MQFFFGIIKLSWFCNASLISLNTHILHAAYAFVCIVKRRQKPQHSHRFYMPLYLSLLLPSQFDISHKLMLQLGYTACVSLSVCVCIWAFDRQRTAMLFEMCAWYEWVSVFVVYHSRALWNFQSNEHKHKYTCKCSGVSRLLPPHCGQTVIRSDVVGGLLTHICM